MLSNLIKHIKQSEKFMSKPYQDSKGFWTIGYGTLLPLSQEEKNMVQDENHLTESEASDLLYHRLEKSIKELQKAKPIVNTLSDARKFVLYDMVYNLGVKGVLGFGNMWTAIENKKHNIAAVEMLKSKWLDDVKGRAIKLAYYMLIGEIK